MRSSAAKQVQLKVTTVNETTNKMTNDKDTRDWTAPTKESAHDEGNGRDVFCSIYPCEQRRHGLRPCDGIVAIALGPDVLAACLWQKCVDRPLVVENCLCNPLDLRKGPAPLRWRDMNMRTALGSGRRIEFLRQHPPHCIHVPFPSALILKFRIGETSSIPPVTLLEFD
jgi:hypothetical protein